MGDDLYGKYKSFMDVTVITLMAGVEFHALITCYVTCHSERRLTNMVFVSITVFRYIESVHHRNERRTVQFKQSFHENC